MGSRSGLGTILAPVLLLSLACVVSADVNITVQTGQEFANAVVSLKTQNGTITLGQPYISLRNATWVLSPVVRPGQLVTVSAGPYASVVDAAMRFALTFPGSAPVKLVLHNFTMVNLCEWRLPRAGGRFSITGLTLGLFLLSREVQGQMYDSMVFYGRRLDAQAAMYVAMAVRTYFPEVRDGAAWLTQELTQLRPVIGRISRYQVDQASFYIPAINAVNVTYKAIEDPNDALLNAMRANGTLMTPSFCLNGTKLPASILNAEVEPGIAPIWTTFTDDELVKGITKALQAYATNVTQGLIPCVYIGGHMTISSVASPVQVPDLLWMRGPLNDIPALAVDAVLGLNNREGVFVMAEGAKVLIEQVTLSGLSSSSVNSSTTPTNQTTSSTTPALPLKAFTSAATPSSWSTQPFLHLDNVTIILPTSEYLALLSISLQLSPGATTADGATDAVSIATATAANARVVQALDRNLTVQGQVARLRPGVTVLQGVVLGQGRRSFTVGLMTAWGMNGTTLTFSCDDAGLVVPELIDTSSGGGGGGQNKAAIIGASVAGGVVLLLAVGALVFWRMRRRQRQLPPDTSSATSKQMSRMAHTPLFMCDQMSHGTTSTTLCNTYPHTSLIGPGMDHTSLGSVRSSAVHVTHMSAPPRCTLEKHVQIRERATATQLGVESLYSGPLPRSLPLAPSASSASASVSSSMQPLAASSAGELASSSVAGAVSSTVNGVRSGVGSVASSSTGEVKGDSKHIVGNTTASGRSTQSAGGDHATTASIDSAQQAMLAMPLSARDDHRGRVGHATAGVDLALKDAGLEFALPVPPVVKSGSGTSSQESRQRSASRPQLQDLPEDEQMVVLEGLQGAQGQGERQLPVLVTQRVGSDAGSSTRASPHERVQTLAAKLVEKGGANQVVVKSVIGRGSYGTVYSGIWRGLPVAIKTMVFNSWDMQVGTPAAMNDSVTTSTSGAQSQPPPMKRTARAIMEAAIAASVGHPNVVATYTYDCKAIGTDMNATTPGGLQITEEYPEDSRTPEGGNKDFKMYLIQELCGNSLESALTNHALRCEANSLTDRPAVLSVLLDIALGLEYLHSNNIIHGDLKPGNVLLKLDTHSPVGVVAKLADFGFSAHIEPMATHISQHNSGSPFYVAPEIVQQWRASPASDVFSFGVIMWQSWTSSPPFVMVPQGGYTFDPRFPRFWKPDIPPIAYSDLMLLCLEYDPHRRPTARQLISVLSQLKASL